MAAARIDEELIGEEVAHCVDVMYANNNAGYPHGREEARSVAGFLATFTRLRGCRSSDQKLCGRGRLPRVWFNTVYSLTGHEGPNNEQRRRCRAASRQKRLEMQPGGHNYGPLALSRHEDDRSHMAELRGEMKRIESSPTSA